MFVLGFGDFMLFICYMLVDLILFFSGEGKVS